MRKLAPGTVFAATSMLAGGTRKKAASGTPRTFAPPVPVLQVAAPPFPPKVVAAPIIKSVVTVKLLAAAKRAVDRQDRSILRDRIAMVDFAEPSSEPRLHLVDLQSGKERSLLVTHGSGSDPDTAVEPGALAAMKAPVRPARVLLRH